MNWTDLATSGISQIVQPDDFFILLHALKDGAVFGIAIGVIVCVTWWFWR